MDGVATLPRWKVLLLMLRTDPWSVGPASLRLVCGLAVVGTIGAYLVHRAWVVGGPIFVALAAVAYVMCLIVCVVKWRPTFGRRNRILPLRDHPRLSEVVREAVEVAGWNRMPRVRVRPWADSVAWRGRWGRGELMLGLPLLLGLEEDELRAIIVCELLHAWPNIRHRRWVLHLNAKDLGRALEGESFRHRDRLRAHAYQVRHELWSATAELVGRELWARAIRRTVMLEHALSWHHHRYVSAVGRPAYVTDAYRTFQWKIRDDGLLARLSPGVDAYLSTGMDRHEAKLLEEFGWVSGEPVHPPKSPAFSGVPEAVERRFGRILALNSSSSLGHRLQGHALADVPAAPWRLYHQHTWQQLFAAVGGLLGRRAYALDVVRLARDGRAAQLDWAHLRYSCPHPDPAVCVLLPLLDVELRARGYAHTDPVRQRELTGPLGDTVDVVRLAADVADGLPYPFDLGGEMTGTDPDADARRLAAEHLSGGDATGWFERLYAESAAGDAIVPWDSRSPHPSLVEWAKSRHLDGKGRRALVVGAGLGDDAEYVARLGYDTTAFDISPSAVRLARARFPASAVAYRVADLFDPPAEWRHGFDLVVEIMTVQSLPEPLHARAIARVGEFVGPDGDLVVIASAREADEPVFAPPWPLTRGEIDAFAAQGLVAGQVEDLREPERRRWRAGFHRPA